MDVVSVSSIMTLARQLADMESTQFVTDAELITYADKAYKEFYDLVVTTFEDQLICTTPLSIPISNLTPEYSLGSNMLKVRLVRLVGVTPKPLVLKRFNLTEISRLSYSFFGYPIGYCLYNRTIRLVPDPSANATLEVWYVPTPTAITASAQTIEVINGYDEYIATIMAIRMRTKEESDVSYLVAQKQMLEKRARESIEDFDLGQPERMVDIQRINEGAIYPFFYGVRP